MVLFLVVSLDRPLAPRNIVVSDIKAESCYLTWDAPEDNERNSLLWVKANDSVVRTTEYPCAGLIEGLEYTFRVSAINRAGQGKPSKKTEFITARTPVDTWVRCNTSSQNVPREEYTATGLEEGAKYQFRVIAKTAVNISRPSEFTDPILVSAENGKHFYIL
uniref:Fibronectin type-III domain-containing protein n=1 Tax=Sinocyclocheilus rhinocerous TaxID=307959 RepID=A0A673JKG1_9TELE